ncbi:MAG: hypothetical protein RIC55_00695 [Pirellulaceae bacterium]
MSNPYESHRQRALAFAESQDWHNAVIVDEGEAESAVVLLRGSGDVTQYRRFRIEVEMKPERLAQIVEMANRDNPQEMEEFLSGTWTLDVTCSATDVIAADWPYIN